MRKSVFFRLKAFTQGRLPSADASSLSISYKVVGNALGDGGVVSFKFVCALHLRYRLPSTIEYLNEQM